AGDNDPHPLDLLVTVSRDCEQQLDDLARLQILPGFAGRDRKRVRALAVSFFAVVEGVPDAGGDLHAACLRRIGRRRGGATPGEHQAEHWHQHKTPYRRAAVAERKVCTPSAGWLVIHHPPPSPPDQLCSTVPDPTARTSALPKALAPRGRSR